MTEYGGIKFALYYCRVHGDGSQQRHRRHDLSWWWKWPTAISGLHPLADCPVSGQSGVCPVLYIWIRASVPRVRYDKFMRFAGNSWCHWHWPIWP
jgi:NADH:ubiquinone oxidoreductase subunit H